MAVGASKEPSVASRSLSARSRRSASAAHHDTGVVRARKFRLLSNPARPSAVVSTLAPYDAVAVQPERVPGAPEHFKLDWNEATVSPSPRVQEALSAYLSGGPGLNWYPSAAGTPLLGALAEYTGLPASQLLVTSGSDDALRLICDTFIDPRDRVAVPEPTYAHFLLFARARDARIRSVTPASPFHTDLDGILAALHEHPRLLYLVNPNNPTGVTYSRAQIETILAAAIETLVVIDEAYIEFGGESAVPLIRDHDNVLVTRTFSKAFGLAGVRVGYVCGSHAAIDALRTLYNPKSVSALSAVAATAALSDMPYLAWYVDEVRRARPMLAEWLRERGIEVYEGEANFLLVRVDDVHRKVAEMRAARVFVRDRSTHPGLGGCFRISVGTVEQTERLIERLAPLLG